MWQQGEQSGSVDRATSVTQVTSEQAENQLLRK